MLHFLGIALASFVYIAAKAFQQLNVVHDYMLMVWPTTFVMAACEVAIVSNIAVQAYDASMWGIAATIAAMTLGSGSGAITSMILHKRMRG